MKVALRLELAFAAETLHQLRQVPAKVVSIFHAQKESRICGDKERNSE